MHPTPAGNFNKLCNGFIGMDLEWHNDYFQEPHYVPSAGSLRLESRYSVHRAKTDSFGMLEMAAKQLTDIAAATAIASGKVKAPTSSKGYQSHEERTMQPSSYVHTPRHVLQTAMQTTDRVCKLLLKRKLSINTEGEKLAAMSGSTEPTPLAPMAGLSGAAALLAEAEVALEDAELRRCCASCASSRATASRCSRRRVDSHAG